LRFYLACLATGAQDFETESDIPLQERKAGAPQKAAAKSIKFDVHIIQMYTFSALSIRVKRAAKPVSVEH
jgi:hypothetical protein